MTDQLSVPTTGTNVLSLFDGADDDFKDMRRKDHLLPRATILQALSPDVVDGKYPSGTVIDSSTHSEIIKAKTSGKFIVPMMKWLEWIEWNRVRNVPKEERILGRSVDPQSTLAKRADSWETYKNNEGKDVCAVTEYYNFIVAIIDPRFNNYDDIYLIGFARSSHRIGKMWLNNMYKRKVEIDGKYVRPPMWATRWAFTTELVKKDGNSYYVPLIGEGALNPREHWEQLKAIADEFKARRAEIMERNSNKEDDHSGLVAEGAVPVNPEM